MANAPTAGLRPEQLKSETPREPSDRTLLECFLARRDETAFAALVGRHGQTVWNVCRRLLPQEADAEDAFQAVFLILARKAASIRKGEAVGSWLYGVAYRTAMRARRSAARRHHYEKRAVPASQNQPEPATGAACRELQQLLDEEVQRLAEKYRAPFVLCHLQGISRADAARELKWKEGTLSGRLARAIKLLQSRLVRRGVTLSAALTATTLAANTASAAAPPVLIQATIEGAPAWAVGQTPGATVSPSAVKLAAAVIGAMATARLKTGLLLFLALTILLTGAGLAAFHLGGHADVLDPDLFVPPPVALGTPIDEQVLSVAFSPDGKKLVTAGGRHVLPGQVQIWDVPGKKNLATVRGIRGVRAVAFAPDGQSFATGDFDGQVKLRDAASGEERAVVQGHNVGVNSLAYSPDGEWLVSAGLDGVLKLWVVKGLQERRVFEGHTGMVFSVAYFHHGPTMVSGGKDKTAIIWNIDTGDKKFVLRGHQAPVEAVAVSPDDKIVATASWDRTIKLWDAASGEEKGVLKESEAQVNAVCFSPDGKLLAGGTYDGKVCLWDLKSRKLLGVLGKHAGAVWALAFSSDGKLLASGSSDKTAKIWQVQGQGGQEVTQLVTQSPYIQPILAVAYSPDGTVLAMATTDSRVQIRNAKTGDVLRVFTGHQGEVNCLVFSADGQTLASGSTDSSVRLWDLITGKEKLILNGHAGEVYALAFAPDGTMLASGGRDKAIVLWDTNSGKQLGSFPGHDDTIRALAFAPKERTLASGSDDHTIKLWDLNGAREPSATFKGHTGAVRALIFTPGGTLASASEDGTVKLWEPAQGKERLTLKGHTEGVWALALTPSGRTLVSGGRDKTLRVWDITSGELRAILQGHTDAVTALAVHPRGKNVVSGSLDTVLYRWQGARKGDLPPALKKRKSQPAPIRDPKINQDALRPAQPKPKIPKAGFMVPKSGIGLLVTLALSLMVTLSVGVWWFMRQDRRKNMGPSFESISAAPPQGGGRCHRKWAWLLGPVALLVLVLVAGRLWFFPPAKPPSFVNMILGREAVSGIEESGFFQKEFFEGEPFRWTDGHGRLVIPIDEERPPLALVLQLRVFRPPNVPSIPVKIRANDRDLFHQPIPCFRHWEKTFDLTGLKLGHQLVLDILSDTFLPKGVMDGGTNTDPRALGVAVWHVRLVREQMEPAAFLNRVLGRDAVLGVKDSGFFPQEFFEGKPFRWTKGHGRLVIPIDQEKPPEKLFMELRVFRPPGVRTIPLQIKANNRELFNQRIRGGKWEKSFDLRELPLGQELVLDIVSDTFAAQELTGGDARRLGVQVWQVQLLREQTETTPGPEETAASENQVWLLVVLALSALGVPLGLWWYLRHAQHAARVISAAAGAGAQGETASISFRCSHCSKKLLVKPEAAGKKVKCPACGKQVTVPETGSPGVATPGNPVSGIRKQLFLWLLPIGFLGLGIVLWFAGEAGSLPKANGPAGAVETKLVPVKAADVAIQVPSDVWSIAVSADGKTVASGAGWWDQVGEIGVWDLATRKPLQRFAEDRGVASVAFSPDGKLLASGSWTGHVRLRDWAAGKQIADFEVGVARIAFSPDGNLLAGVTEGATAHLWDVARRRPVADLDGDLFRFHCVAFSPDGQRLFAGGGNWKPNGLSQVTIWDVAGKKQVGKLNGHRNAILCVAVSSDGKTVAASGVDPNIILWDADSGKRLNTLSGHLGWVESVVFTDGDKTLVSGSHDGTVRFWDVAGGKERSRIIVAGKPWQRGTPMVSAFNLAMRKPFAAPVRVRALRFTPDGKTLLVGGGPRTLKLFDAVTHKEMAALWNGLPLPKAPADIKPEPPGVAPAPRQVTMDELPAVSTPNQEHVADVQIKDADPTQDPNDTAVADWTGWKTWLALGLIAVLASGLWLAVRSFRRKPQESGGLSRRVWISGLACLTLLAAGTTLWLVFGNRESSTEATSAVYQDFRGSRRPVPPFYLDGVDAETRAEAGGLRISLPATRKQPSWKAVGVVPSLRLCGDFEITGSYELLSSERPGPGAAVGVSLWLATGLSNNTKFAQVGRFLGADGDFYVGQHWVYVPKMRGQRLPTTARTGKLRFTRQGSILRFLVADDDSNDFHEITRTDFGTDDLITRFVVNNNTRPTAVDARLVDLRIRAASLTPDEPPPDADQSPEIHASEIAWKAWLALGLLLALALGVVLALRQSRRAGKTMRAAANSEAAGNEQARPEAASPTLSFPCSGCGTKLKAKSALAGKTVKCPRCARTVIIPDSAAGESPPTALPSPRAKHE